MAVKDLSREDISNLAYSAVKAQSMPDPNIERLIAHLEKIQGEGVRLGYETSVWHENAKLNGKPCNCARCRPTRKS